MASMPTTPDSCDVTFGNRADLPRRKGLTIDTSCPQPQYYTGNASMSSYSTPASVMHTAVDYDPYSSSFFMASPASPSKGTNNFLGAVDLGPSFMSEDNEMASPSEWRFSDTQQSTSSRYSSMKSSIAATSFDTASPDIDIWAELRQPPQQLFPTYIHSSSESTPPPQRPFSPSRKHLDGKTKSSSIFNPIKFFPRSSPSHSTSSPKAAHDGEAHPPPESFASFTFSQASHSPLSSQTNSWAEISSPRPGCAVQLNSPQERSCRRAPYLRSPRQWFMTGKLFASTGAS